MTLIQLSPQTLNLCELIFHETLSCESRVNRHHLDTIRRTQYSLNRCEGCFRIYCNTCFDLQLLDRLENRRKIFADLLVHDDPIRAGARKFFKKVLGIVDHKVSVQE